MKSLQRILSTFTRTVRDPFFWLFKVYALFFFLFLALDAFERGIVSYHIPITVWAGITISVGVVALLSDYFSVEEEKSSQPLVGSLYTILLVSCIIIWIILTMFV